MRLSATFTSSEKLAHQSRPRSFNQVREVARQKLGCVQVGYLRARIFDQVLGDEAANFRSPDQAILRMTQQTIKVRLTHAARIEHLRIALQNAAVPRMRALRSRQFEGKEIGRCRRVQLSRRAAHEGMIACRKKGEQISQVATAAVAQSSQIFNARERVLGFIPHRKVALSNRAAKERASRFSFDQQVSLVAAQLNYSVRVVRHTTFSFV